MAVSTIARFRTLPDQGMAHMAASAEAVGHLRRLGRAAVALQPVAGGDVGSMLTTVTYADNADWATSMQRVLADEGWQEFWARVSVDQPAEQVESSIFADLDPTFQPAADRPLGVISATQWRAHPGKLADFGAQVEKGVAHITRLGGTPRVMQSLVGQHPMTTLVAIAHADLDGYAAFSDAAATDEEFQAFWLSVGLNPSADLVRSGVYLNISD